MEIHGQPLAPPRDGAADVRVPVLVVGAGPVGLTLALDLAWRGIPCLLAEVRHFREPPNVKCNHVAARTMEQFRRLGVAAKVRAAGLPDDHPNDVAFRTALTGREMSRVRIPSRLERFSDTSGPDGWWPTPEPPHRVNQVYLEPILVDHAVQQAGLTLANRLRVIDFVQDGAGVLAQAEDLDTGKRMAIACDYLVGCDGARSTVRKAIGGTLSGQSEIKKVQSTLIDAPGLWDRVPGRRAWCYYALNPRRTGTIFCIDGRDRWLVHNSLRPDETDFDAVDRDRCLRAILGVDADFEFTVVSKEDWVARRLVADRLRAGRAFIAGDAAHLWAPHGGFGMNAGIADALDLSWMLAARMQGWGAPGLLEAYQAERLPITDQVSRHVAGHGSAKRDIEADIPARIEEDSAEGEALRADLGQRNYALHVRQFCAAGLNFGYYYDQSPIIAYDSETPPPYGMGEFTSSTVPGCRAPHFRLRDGRSLYDACGPYYTLLRFDRSASIGALEDAAAAAGMPLTVLEVEADDVPAAYRHALVLCRPDQHVAWRGDAVPGDARALVELLRGAAPSQNETTGDMD
ncbi:MAG: monooxygenase [Ramlibacter sp.]|nr:monooxygenase [Ramlibacter sp.]